MPNLFYLSHYSVGKFPEVVGLSNLYFKAYLMLLEKCKWDAQRPGFIQFMMSVKRRTWYPYADSEDNRSGLMVYLDDDGKTILGVAYISDGYNIQRICVAEGGKGMGRQFVKALVEKMATAECIPFGASVDYKVVPFFRKCGFLRFAECDRADVRQFILDDDYDNEGDTPMYHPQFVDYYKGDIPKDGVGCILPTAIIKKVDTFWNNLATEAVLNLIAHEA